MARKTAKESILQERTVKTPKVSVKSDERNRSLKKISIISTALIVAICIVFNILLDLTLDKKLTFDATSVQQNTVSILTKNFIEKLDKKVEIIGLFNRNNAISDWKDYCLPLLDDYESKADGMIELKYIDPDVDPFILKQLDPDNLYGLRKDTYVIRCGDLLTTVDPYSCFVYDANMLQYYNLAIPTTNNLEREFTGRIMYVTSGRALHAYYLSGHNLPTHYYLDQILKSLGFASSEITLKGENAKIPDDCTLLVILQPDSDITPTEKELIKSYLDNSGEVLVVNGYDTEKAVEYPNLNEVTNRMGIIMEAGLLHENDMDHLLSTDDPYSFIADIDSDYGSKISMPANYTVEKCRYLKTSTDKKSSLSVSPLIVTSGSTSVDFENAQIDSAVSAGTYPVALWSVDSDTSDKASMIVIGSSSFTSDKYYEANTLSDNNAVFLRNLLGDINTIHVTPMVPGKSVPSYILSKPLSSSSATTWSVIVMTVIPLGSLICGVYIYRKRRHL